MIADRPMTMTDALAMESAKKLLAVSPSIGSAELRKLAPSVRERAFFSARTPYADYLSQTKRMIEGLVQPDVRITPDGLVPTTSGESLSPAQVRARMKKHLASIGYQPDEDQRGGLQDLSSDRRINLIIDTQLKMSRGYGRWREAQAPAVLDAWPADEMYRAIRRRVPRDWARRWNEARSALGDATSATLAQDDEAGPFVALKNDPVWSEISVFGNPYPPFDFQSGMRVRDVPRRRAIALGVLAEDEDVKPDERGLNDEIAQPVADLDRELVAALVDALGAGAKLIGGLLKLV